MTSALLNDDMHGPYHIVLVVGTPGREDAFVSIVDADTLGGVRDFLIDARKSLVLHRWAKNRWAKKRGAND